eukprot:comp21786_c0_seq1/m.48865 comp21786_c0_seq1/g.48865  ORF comp21786_c0_seq1/g.48865 comp21786_c0_seq1/m.48865 type:complete len:481 (-) comp21786_c0_seq1:408-1850(-)
MRLDHKPLVVVVHKERLFVRRPPRVAMRALRCRLPRRTALDRPDQQPEALRLLPKVKETAQLMPIAPRWSRRLALHLALVVQILRVEPHIQVVARHPQEAILPAAARGRRNRYRHKHLLRVVKHHQCATQRFQLLLNQTLIQHHGQLDNRCSRARARGPSGARPNHSDPAARKQIHKPHIRAILEQMRNLLADAQQLCDNRSKVAKERNRPFNHRFVAQNKLLPRLAPRRCFGSLLLHHLRELLDRLDRLHADRGLDVDFLRRVDLEIRVRKRLDVAHDENPQRLANLKPRVQIAHNRSVVRIAIKQRAARVQRLKHTALFAHRAREAVAPSRNRWARCRLCGRRREHHRNRAEELNVRQESCHLGVKRQILKTELALDLLLEMIADHLVLHRNIEITHQARRHDLQPLAMIRILRRHIAAGGPDNLEKQRGGLLGLVELLQNGLRRIQKRKQMREQRIEQMRRQQRRARKRLRGRTGLA